MGGTILAEAFVVTVVGGMGSIGGAVLAGLLVGVVVSMSSLFAPEMAKVSIFALMAIGLITLRRRADFRPAFRAPLGAALPLAFAAAALLVAVNQIAAAPVESLTGLLLVLLGWPVFVLWSRRTATRTEFVANAD